MRILKQERAAVLQRNVFLPAGFDENNVAVRVGDRQIVLYLGIRDLLLVKEVCGLREAFGFKDDFGARAESSLGDLDLLAGVSGKVEEHRVACDGLEGELVDVEVAGSRGVL